VAKRNPEFTTEDCERVGAQLAVAAIRYFMLKFFPRQTDRLRHRRGAQLRGRNRALPAVRRRGAAGNILHKLQEREGLSEADVLAALDASPASELTAESDEGNA